jgi:hypothetical protein
MNLRNTLNALERERQLLEDFICLSEEQLLLLEDENLDGFDSLLEQRSQLMRELTGIERVLTSWILDIQANSLVSPADISEMTAMNEEIVRMANHVVDIDEQAHRRLEHIRQRTQSAIMVSMGKAAAPEQDCE